MRDLHGGTQTSRELLHVAGVVSLIGVLSSACAVGPEFVRPEPPPTQDWSANKDPHLAAQAAADSQWWKSFNDPALDHLVELAWGQNLPLQVAGLRIIEARAQLGIATGQQYPQVQVVAGSATAMGLSKNAPNAALLPNRNFGDYQVGFDAAWELDFWGKYRRAVQSQSDSLLASEADYDSALVSLAAEVARTYVVIRTFEVLIDEAQQNATVQQQAVEIAQSRFRNGATSELDVAQASTLWKSTQATIPQLQAGLQQSRNALSTLLGQPTGTVEALLAGPTGIPKPPAKVAMGVPAEMLRRRPDIRSAELTAAAQCARIGVAKADLYPSFTLFGTIGLETSSGTGPRSNFFSSDSIFYSVGPHINWPFLNYGRITNAVRVEDARFQEALVNYRDTVIRAAQEVQDAMAGFLDNEQALAFEQDAVTAAQRSVEIAVRQYREGATDYQRVLDAERSLLQQENSLTQVSSSVATNLIALYKALGGGWELHQGQPIVPGEAQRQMKERTDWGDLLSPPAGKQ